MTRWVAVLFRLGTVLISISLAMFLVSLIPASQGPESTSTISLSPQSWQSYYSITLSPQFGIHVNVTGSGAFTVYLLEVEGNEIYTWIAQHYSALDFSNITQLNAFLNAHPTLIARQDQNQNLGVQYDFIPTTVINATVVIANPTAESLTLNYEVRSIRPFGPASVTLLGEITSLIGVVLILPLLGRTLTLRRHKKPMLGKQCISESDGARERPVVFRLARSN